jgi:uncharacterized membrane protein YfcA
MVALIMGTALGFLSGLGVGGGSLLMLWLTAVAGADHSHARIMNLMFFVPCALIATWFRWRKSRPDGPVALSAVLGGLAGAVLGNLLHARLELSLLRKALGGLFLICGIKELFYRRRELR